MPIRVRCTDCSAEYNLADTLAGKKIRCKKCQGVIAVPAAEDEGVTAPAPKRKVAPEAKVRPAAVREDEDDPRPKRRRDEEEDDEVPPRKKGEDAEKKKLPLAWIIGGGVGAVVLIGGIVLAVVLMRGKSDPTANGDKGSNTDRSGKAEKWAARADPGADFQIPRDARFELPLKGAAGIWFSPPPHPFVLVATSEADKPGRTVEVIDLRTGKRHGSPMQMAVYTIYSDPVVSPDGSAVAVDVKTHRAIFSTTTGQQIARIANGEYDRLIGFPTPDRLLSAQVVTRPQVHVVYDLWDAKTGAKQASYPTTTMTGMRYTAISPAGRYAALPSSKSGEGGLILYDLTNGASAGEVRTPGGKPKGEVIGIDFTPDGRLLSALIRPDNKGDKVRIVTWGMEDGRLVSDHLVSNSLIDLSPSLFGFEGRQLEWLADGKGWMVRGSVLVDADKGIPYWKLPTVAPDAPITPRRVVGDTHFVGGKRSASGVMQLALEPLSRDEVDAARKTALSGQ